MIRHEPLQWQKPSAVPVVRRKGQYARETATASSEASDVRGAVLRCCVNAVRQGAGRSRDNQRPRLGRGGVLARAEGPAGGVHAASTAERVRAGTVARVQGRMAE